MEHNKETLKNALQNLPSYEPEAITWNAIDQKLNELPLQHALASLPEYEPDEQLWQNIQQGSQRKIRNWNPWWYAAAMLVTGCFFGFWFTNKNTEKMIAYSEEVADQRLQVTDMPETDSQYLKLKTWCESEAIVCNTVGFKQLKKEYEVLQLASEQLQAAMGNYNSEPELVRQLSMVEQEKAGILNKMAKMI